MKSLATNFRQYLCENEGTRRIVVDKAPLPPSLAYQTFDLPARDRLQTTLLVQIECDDIIKKWNVTRQECNTPWNELLRVD